jgi:hypothetical protein
MTADPDSIQVSWLISVIVLGKSRSSGRIAVTPKEKLIKEFYDTWFSISHHFWDVKPVVW